MMAKISVIIPVYNVQNYVGQCIESVLNQTFSDLEIICVNDGSTDNSGKILDMYARKDTRIKVIHKKNTGYGNTMNTGIELACGEYIGIVESDDFIELDMYEKLYSIAHEFDLDFVKSNYWKYSDEGRIPDTGLVRCECGKVLSRYENMEKIFSARSVWTGLYKKEFLVNNQIKFLETPGASYQDTSFWFKVCITAERGYFFDEPLVNYRVDNAGSSVKSMEKIFCICDEMKECQRYLSKTDLDTENIFPYFLVHKISIYAWNVRRLPVELKEIFIQRIKEELEKDIFGLPEKVEFLPDWRVGDLLFAIQHFESYCRYTDRQFLQITRENEKGIFDMLKCEKSIYIYGAGKAGERFRKQLISAGISVIMQYIVTRIENEKKKDVISIDSESINTENAIIVCIADECAKREMIIRAFDRGFEKIYVL